MPNIFSLLTGNRLCRALFMTVLVYLDHVSLLDVDTKELEALNLLHYSLVDKNGSMLSPHFPVVHSHFLSLDHVEGEMVILAPHGQVSDLFHMGGLIVVDEQAYHCCVVYKLNDGVMSAVLSGPRVEDQMCCYLPLPWGWPVSESSIQLQREVFSPKVLSLVMSFEGTMVLNAEL